MRSGFPPPNFSDFLICNLSWQTLSRRPEVLLRECPVKGRVPIVLGSPSTLGGMTWVVDLCFSHGTKIGLSRKQTEHTGVGWVREEQTGTWDSRSGCLAGSLRAKLLGLRMSGGVASWAGLTRIQSRRNVSTFNLQMLFMSPQTTNVSHSHDIQSKRNGYWGRGSHITFIFHNEKRGWDEALLGQRHYIWPCSRARTNVLK